MASDGPRALAARQFDDSCRLARGDRGDRLSNAALGERLGDLAGRRRPSRWTVLDWRHGTRDVPAWALLAAFRLAGLTQRLERGGRRSGPAGPSGGEGTDGLAGPALPPTARPGAPGCARLIMG